MSSNIKYYILGVIWFLAHLATSVFNDVIMKYTGISLPSFEVAFFRFLFGTISLIPFIIYYGKNSIKTSNHIVHLIRGILLFLGISAWVYGLTIVPVVTATLISFSVPLFILLLAVFFLKENIIWQRWAATIIGFAGITVVLQPTADEFNPEVLIFLVAAVIFATLDIINKKFIVQETMISMLFYSAIVTTFLATPLTLMNWVQPSIVELGLLFLLGCTGNLILFFLLKAFALADATALAPFRYFELLLSGIAGYIFFHEIPEKHIIYGALIIIPSTLFVIYSEKKNLDSHNQDWDMRKVAKENI